MSDDVVEMRLVRATPYRVLSRWEQAVDTRDGKAMKAALVGAVKGEVGEGGDWEALLPHRILEWRWGPSSGWRTWRSSK